MAGRMIDRRKVVLVVVQGAGITLAGLLVMAVVAMTTILLVSPRVALSTEFFRGSVGALLLTNLATGLAAGRRSAGRLRKAGVRPGLPRYVLASSGPAGMALLTGLAQAQAGLLVLGTLAPACAAAAGAALGFRLAARRGDLY